MATKTVPAPTAERRPLKGANLGERISDAIDRAGLSKSEAARQAGTDYQTLHKWTKGQEPRAGWLPALCKVLGVTADELLGIAEGADPPFEAWQDFLCTPQGQSMTPEEARALRMFNWPSGFEPTVFHYSATLQMLRMPT